jgi:DNA helicase HerA-like ATPase
VKGREPFFLTFDRRQRGVYVSGKPRTGKSTFLLNLILDDFRERRPAFVIDPHGELIDEILRRLLLSEPQAEERVLVFDFFVLGMKPGDIYDHRQDLFACVLIALIRRRCGATITASAAWPACARSPR